MSDTNRQTQLENELLAEILLDEMYNLKDIEAEMKHHEIISSNIKIDGIGKGSGHVHVVAEDFAEATGIAQKERYAGEYPTEHKAGE